MKIGIDARLYSSLFTGIGRYTYELIDNLKRIDKINKYYIFLNYNEYNGFQETANFKKVLVDSKHYSLSEQVKFLSILDKYNLDLVHFIHFNKPLFYNKNFVTTIHDLTLHFFKGKKKRGLHHRIAYNMVMKNAVNKSKNIIVPSENTKKDILKFYNIDAKKIHVVYEGISKNFKKIVDTDRKVQTKYNINKPYLLYTGVWREHKNLKRLILAFEKVLKSGFDIQLVITGKYDKVYKDLLDLPKSLNISDKVIFTNKVPEDELIKLYSEAKIFVFPSLYEGFGLPPLEAMACGTPVVASNVSSIPEVCGKENALFFNPLDIQDISNKIVSLLKDEKLQKSLISKGYRHIKNFSWYNMSKTILNIYSLSK